MTTLVPPPARLNPYVGPRPFQRGERLYGRDREVARLRDVLIAERIVLLYSPSGAGKTSLIEAGLVPELEQEGFLVLPVIRVGAEPAPVDGTAPPVNRYVRSTLLSLQQGRAVDGMAGTALGAYLDQRAGEHDDVVLIFDQFEELLAADPTDLSVKSAFLTELGAALRDRRRWTLFAMREDFLAGLDPYLRLLPTHLRTTFRLDLLSTAAARLAIQGPAREAGADFTDAAADRLVESLSRVRVRRSGELVDIPGPYVEPVQLQVVCERLWERPRADARRITESDVQEVGDIDSALAEYYAEKVRVIAAETGADERVLRTWFDRALIAEPGLRAQVLVGPLQGAGEDDLILRLLQEAHLIGAENRGSARWFELAHDRLIEPVQASNAAWRETNLQPFQRQAALWQSEDQPDHLLLTGDALPEADRWVAAHPGELTAAERQFLAASRARNELQRGRAQRVRWVLVAVSIVSGAVLAIFAFAVYNIRLAYSRQLVSEAATLFETDPAAALEKAVGAMVWPSASAARIALASSLAQSHVRAIISGHRDGVTSANLSPDGQRLVTVSTDGTVRVWEARTGVEQRVLEGHPEGVFSAQWSPDGSRIVTASADNTARVWNASTGQQQRILEGHQQDVLNAQWSPDGSRIVTASLDDTARVWNVDSDQEPLVLRHERPVFSAHWSPDGSWIVTGNADGTARVWNAASAVERVRLPQRAGSVSSAVFSPDGRLVVAGGVGGSTLWEWGSPRLLTPLAGNKAVFSPDGRRVLTVDGEMVRVWDVDREDEIVALPVQAPVKVASFSRDGTRIVSGSDDGTIRIWDVASGGSLVELRGHQSVVNDLAFSPHQPDPARLTLVSAGADGTARIWDPYIGQVLSWPDKAPNSASFSADGDLVIGGGADGVARVWRSATGEPAGEFAIGSPSLESAAFNRDGRRIVTGANDGRVRVWEGPDREMVAELQVEGSVNAVVFDPHGRSVAIAGPDDTARIWEWASTTRPHLLRGHDDLVTDVAFSPDGSRVATASRDRTARIWDAATGEQLHTLRGHADVVYSVEFSPDGRLVVTASDDKTARIWDAMSGRELSPLTGHENGLVDAAFSGDSNYVVTGSVDGSVGVWEASTGQRLAFLPMHSNAINSLQFSPTGLHILTASQDGTARVYDCAICAPITDLRERAGDRLRYVARRIPDSQAFSL